MFRLFKRKRVVVSNPLQEKAAGWFVAKVLWLQGKWALYMDRRVNRLSVRSKKFGLMVFVGLSILVCISIVVETFTSQEYHSFRVGNIHSIHTVKEPVSAFIPESNYKRVLAFQKYMDSLYGSVSGRKVHDSIVRCRPGLLDSAKLLEKLYHSQNK